jgi:DNA (cytosine-5)-methyltransferase 1
MRVASLFSGIGGLDLGLEREGSRVALQVELDGRCLAVLYKHWKDTEKLSHVESVTPETCPDVDLLAGGFPCQDASIMRGRWSKRGFGERTRLYWEFFRVASLVRPKVVLLENVTGILTADEGRLFTSIITSLDNLGYVGEWRVLDGAAFGLPLRREHVFIVGFDRRAFGGIPKGFRMDDSDDWNPARQQLLERGRQAWTEDRGPFEGRDYRKLTPEECEIALGFPVGWTSGSSDSQRYRQLGNAVAVPCARWVGRRILDAVGGSDYESF